jgi:glycosyltransferase involved in cell wall biosynthesis
MSKSMSAPRKNRPAYVLITPARNEQPNIGRLIECMIKQTQLPLRWVIVNDGSTDETAAIVRPYCAKYPWIELVDLPPRRERTFAAKVHSFNAGYERVKDLPWEVVGNLDADLSFDPDYLEFLMDKFAEDSGLGVAGTIFREPGYSSETNSFEGQNHVAGGCQMFRRACFDEVGGYVPNKAGGIDWIAVTTARMKGWKTRQFREKCFFHHRPLGTAERGRLASAFSYGEKDYYLGGGPLWESFRIVFQMRNSPLIIAGLALGAGYVSAALRRMKRPVSRELMKFHRKEQAAKLKAILSSLARLKRLDSFQVMPAAGRRES